MDRFVNLIPYFVVFNLITTFSIFAFVVTEVLF